MANPSFNEKLLQRISVIESSSDMTVEGTVNKTGILLLLAACGAYFGWNTSSAGLLIAALIATLVLSLIIIFGPHRAAFLSQPYALAEGFLLGSISSMYQFKYPGIVSNALILTFGCLAVMLVLYKYRIIHVTEKFRSIIVAATLAIALTYFISMIMGFFGHSMTMIHESSPLGIAFSVVVVGVAAMNLLLDFDMIDKLARQRSPKVIEWYGGFALLVTIVWLYIEILRLLSKLNKK